MIALNRNGSWTKGTALATKIKLLLVPALWHGSIQRITFKQVTMGETKTARYDSGQNRIEIVATENDDNDVLSNVKLALENETCSSDESQQIRDFEDSEVELGIVFDHANNNTCYYKEEQKKEEQCDSTYIDSSVSTFQSSTLQQQNAIIQKSKSKDESFDLSPYRSQRSILKTRSSSSSLSSRSMLGSSYSNLSQHEQDRTKLSFTVTFQNVEIREYDRVLGDNPSCRNGE